MQQLHLVGFIGGINKQRYGPHGPLHPLHLARRGSQRHVNSPHSLFMATFHTLGRAL